MNSICFSIDIDPRCSIESGVYIDHGTGVVIGETAKVGSNVLIFHGVTLGSLKIHNVRNKKRHPTVGSNVTIGCNSIILGDIYIEDGSKIAAGSFVIKDTKNNCGSLSEKDIGVTA